MDILIMYIEMKNSDILLYLKFYGHICEVLG